MRSTDVPVGEVPSGPRLENPHASHASFRLAPPQEVEDRVGNINQPMLGFLSTLQPALDMVSGVLDLPGQVDAFTAPLDVPPLPKRVHHGTPVLVSPEVDGAAKAQSGLNCLLLYPGEWQLGEGIVLVATSNIRT